MRRSISPHLGGGGGSLPLNRITGAQTAFRIRVSANLLDHDKMLLRPHMRCAILTARNDSTHHMNGPRLLQARGRNWDKGRPGS